MLWRLSLSDVANGYTLVTLYQNGVAGRQELYDRYDHLQHWQNLAAGYSYYYDDETGMPSESRWYRADGRLQTYKRYCPRSGEVIVRYDY